MLEPIWKNRKNIIDSIKVKKPQNQHYNFLYSKDIMILRMNVKKSKEAI
jgi:hypothetical protein